MPTLEALAWRALRGGPATSTELVARLPDYEPEAVRKALARLAEHGYAEPVDAGVPHARGRLHRWRVAAGSSEPQDRRSTRRPAQGAAHGTP